MKFPKILSSVEIKPILWLQRLTILLLLFSFTLITTLMIPVFAQDVQQTVRNQKMIEMEQRLGDEFNQYLDVESYPEVFNNIGNYNVKSKTSNKNSRQMAEDLAILDQKTNTKSAVMWVMPEETQLHLVLVTAKGEIVVKDITEAPRAILISKINDFYQEINRISYPMDLTTAKQLYQWIIAPFEKEIFIPEKINNILFCFGEGTRTLPFAALHDGHKFAIEKYNMSRIPGFNLINTNYKSLKKPSILAMGASQFVQNEPLPGVGLELESIFQQVKTSNITNNENIFFNQNFTLPNMQNEVQNKSFDIVHLATHADFNPGSPSNSYIQFWDDKLTLDKMSRLRWKTPPELLVLSACNTALGNEDAELGFTGVALQSGVKSALGSLWYISDYGTLALITEFYTQLIGEAGNNLTKVEALTKAQNMLLQGKVYFDDNHLITPHGNIDLPSELKIKDKLLLSHPFYWASFTLISSPW
jgi:CHAT domain-containing protein